MKYSAVVFDLDGTLTASAPGICSSIRYTIEQMGTEPIDEALLSQFVGPPLYSSFQKYAGYTPEQTEKAVAIYREHYTENGVLNAHVFQGIPNLLRQLKANGVFVALASAKPTTSVHRVLEHFGLSRFFDRIIGSPPARREESKVALLHDALPVRYTRAAMVGDRKFDIEAAKELGLDAIGVEWGYGSMEELAGAKADVIAPTVDDLAYILLGDQKKDPRGFFISIEGLDGSGKTTQMNAVASYVISRGYDVLTTREPGGTPISEDIRRLVLDPEKTVCAETEALLYAAARAQHVQDLIRPALAKGKVVLCDRFMDSSIVYQGAGRELGVEKVAAINAFAVGGTLPDMTLLLIVDAQTAFLRRSSATNLDRIERAGEAFFQRVYNAFAKIATMNPERVRCIDAQRAVGAITEDACAQIDRLFASR